MMVIFKILKEVFQKPAYLIWSVCSSLFFLLFLVWLPNLYLLKELFFSKKMGFGEKFLLIFNSFDLINGNFTLVSAVMMLTIAILFSINLALIGYYIQCQKRFLPTGGFSLLGALSGTLGVGCASCGSVVLSYLGLSGAITFLPFGGREFRLLAIVLLISSLYVTARKIAFKTCKIR